MKDKQFFLGPLLFGKKQLVDTDVEWANQSPVNKEEKVYSKLQAKVIRKQNKPVHLSITFPLPVPFKASFFPCNIFRKFSGVTVCIERKTYINT